MFLELKIEDVELQKALKIGAEQANMDINDYALTMLTYSFNTSSAILTTEKLIGILEGDFLERLMTIQMNSFATRHQITNLHADLLGDNEQRALDIAAEANEIAEQSLNDDEE